MSARTLSIQFPTAGVVRRLGLSAGADGQGNLATPWGINVRLEDSLTNRLRGGSFTGQAASSVSDPRYLSLVTENEDTVTTENGDTVAFGPQYEVAAGDERLWASDGEDAPTAGTADCLYRARLFRVDGNVIQVSRQGDTTEWDYGGELNDEGRATLLQLSEAGEVGGSVIAMVPHRDAHLLCFTAGETWILTGDPTTGSLRNVSREVGIIGARAWCKNHDTVYFMSSLGLYSVGADGGGLKAVSEDRIPEDLTSISDSACVLDYRHQDRSVSIHLTTSPSWLYDSARDGFWPFDTTETDSHILIGPFQVGNANSYSRILRLYGVTAEGSADVTWHIVPGDTAEEAAANGKAAIAAALASSSYASYVHSSGDWVAGINNSAYPRTRTQWIVIWLSASADWAWETAFMDVTASAKWR